MTMFDVLMMMIICKRRISVQMALPCLALLYSCLYLLFPLRYHTHSLESTVAPKALTVNSQSHITTIRSISPPTPLPSLPFLSYRTYLPTQFPPPKKGNAKRDSKKKAGFVSLFRYSFLSFFLNGVHSVRHVHVL